MRGQEPFAAGYDFVIVCCFAVFGSAVLGIAGAFGRLCNTDIKQEAAALQRMPVCLVPIDTERENLSRPVHEGIGVIVFMRQKEIFIIHLCIAAHFDIFSVDLNMFRQRRAEVLIEIVVVVAIPVIICAGSQHINQAFSLLVLQHKNCCTDCRAGQYSDHNLMRSDQQVIKHDHAAVVRQSGLVCVAIRDCHRGVFDAFAAFCDDD